MDLLNDIATQKLRTVYDAMEHDAVMTGTMGFGVIFVLYKWLRKFSHGKMC